MNNILNIIRHDLKKITGSVVAIVTIMGLCIVPCLYAWFNIFSNWSPYESEATGRILVAVANEDEGAKVSGLTVNVGDKIVEALAANDAIGWRFVNTEGEATEGVYKGDYYAALVIPQGFSREVLSFMDGNLMNPKIKYYENEKKNAIAPKITSKAQTALKEEVNAAFVETLAGYVSDAASIAKENGSDPDKILNDLAGKTAELGRDIDSCIALSKAASGLTGAAGGLLDVSGSLVDSTQDVLNQNDKLLDGIAGSVPDKVAGGSKLRKVASEVADVIAAGLTDLNNDVSALLAEPQNNLLYKAFVAAKDVNISITDQMQQQAEEQAETLNQAGFTALAGDYAELSERLRAVSYDLSLLESNMTVEQRTNLLSQLASDINSSIDMIGDIRDQIRLDIDTSLAQALSDTKNSIIDYRSSLNRANGDLGSLSRLMSRYGRSLNRLENSVDLTTDNLKSLQNSTSSMSDMLTNAKGNKILSTLSGLMANDEAAVAEYLANPVKMDTEVFWQIENYGSAMAPFYTVLAQWVGALLTAVLIKVKVRKRDDLTDLKLHEWYFGRFGLYLYVGITQALIVSLGDLYYIGIQCTAPLKFILAACINGLVFMMINYALVFALDNIGLGAAVIILVLQVAGSGGTYPVEVLPEPFKVLYPFMPFRYAMDAMRECIGGMYGNTYWHCIGVLMIFFVFASAFGIAMYRPALWLNELIAESKAKSEIML